jgi:hypothetical protein
MIVNVYGAVIEIIPTGETREISYLMVFSFVCIYVLEQWPNDDLYFRSKLGATK